MIIASSQVGICVSPCRCVKLKLFISLCSKISSKASETSLPLCIAIGDSPPESNVAVTMDENDGDFANFLGRSSATSIRSAFNVGSVEIKRGVT